MENDFIKRIKEVKKIFGKQEHEAIPYFDDAPCYPLEQLVELAKLQQSILFLKDAKEREREITQFADLLPKIKKLSDAPERIYLWPKGCVPTQTEYTDNSEYRYNHDPGYEPYLFEMLLPEDVAPKGTVIISVGGDHGVGTVYEGLQTCRDLNAFGYHCILLNNRPNHNPWNELESGVDTARAVRYVRSKAEEYRIDPHSIAVLGCSNGGVSCEACILYFSGRKTVADYFPDYEPDVLDAFSGAPDAFICLYGPHFADEPIDFRDVNYPPTFYGVGREDSAMNNLHYIYPILVEHGVDVEVHTFAATPHGYAGMHLLDGESKYPNWELWLPLADAFLQDAFMKK